MSKWAYIKKGNDYKRVEVLGKKGKTLLVRDHTVRGINGGFKDYEIKKSSAFVE